MARPKLPPSSVVLPEIKAVLDSGYLTKGPHLAAFEADCARYLGVRHCLGVSSCTSGLMLCFQALARKASKAPRRIAVPSFTFMASLSSMLWAGFEPVFVEVDPSTMNLCLDDLEGVLKRESVAAVLAVHCFGNPVPQARLERLCEEAEVALLYDSAHAFGSLQADRKVASSGWAQVYSLTPTKMVVAGEGGVIATNDDDLAGTLKLAREYGNDGTYDSLLPGLNARLSEIHAIIARHSLTMLEEVVASRNEMACAFTGALSKVAGVGFQTITQDSRTTYKDFTITIDPGLFGCSRDAAAWALAAEGVPSRKYFFPPCHQHTAYRRFSKRALPRTDLLADRSLSLPLLEKAHAEPLAEALVKIQGRAGRVEEEYHAREKETASPA